MPTTPTTRTDYEESLRAEISAMRRIIAALEPLDPPTQERIVRYLADRYLSTGKEPT